MNPVSASSVEQSRLRGFATNVRAAVLMFFRLPRPPGRRSAWPPQGRLVLGAIAAVVILTATVMLIDVRSLAGARQLPAGVVQVFRYITDLGLSGWFLYPAAFVLLLLAVLDSPRLPGFLRCVLATVAFRAGFIFMAIAVPGLFVAVVKRLIGRARPYVAGDDAWTSLWFGWSSAYAAFPSGHATTAFAAAVAIGALWPKLRPLMWVYAVAIAVSRVIVTAHHPSDVIAGAIVGTIGALLVRNWYASRRLGFAVQADGSVLRLPGPSWRRIKAVARRAVSA
jgi:membrane-associated phospholipid phosphatase